jgi:hypothetical protein
MVRHRLLSCLALVAVVLFFAAPAAIAAEPDITGKYNCEGTNPDGKTYKGTVQIVKKGDAYYLKWAIGAGDNYAGVGILEGNVLAVSYYGGISGVVVYRVEKGGKLVGKWSIADGKGKVYTETLTK